MRVRQELRQTLRQEFGQEHNWDEGLPLVLYAGRICDQKQPQVFVETMQQLRHKTPDFLAVVAGDGPEFGWLQARISHSGLQDKVYVLGAVSNGRVRELMTAADIFFLPSQWEGIALSIFEAMACGVAVVGADVGGQRELVTPECGILIERGKAGDPSAEAARYAEILAELLNDPHRRTALGQAGAARIRQHFRLDQMGERMIGLFQEARDLHTNHPHPIPDVEWGQARAARIMTYLRVQSAARRLVSPTTRAFLDKKMKWLLPVKETLERVLLR
jgi:glycosyltransferase involved in cell wall biosynthesis